MRSVPKGWVARSAPFFHSLLWLGFLMIWRTSGMAERHLGVLRAAARPAVPTLQLEMSGPAGAPAAYQYEIGLIIAGKRPSSFVIAGPAAAGPGSAASRQSAITLRGALASWDPRGVAPLPLQVQIAVRDAAGCIVYGGERSLIFSGSAPSAATALGPFRVRVILQRLPQSICTQGFSP